MRGSRKRFLVLSSLFVILGFLSFNIQNKVYAADAYNSYRMIGGVGNKLYYIGNANTYQRNSSVNAMTKWNNSNGGLTWTPIWFSQTTNRPDSDIDIMFSNFGNTGWYGSTEWYRSSTKLNSWSGTPTGNWSWSKINMNDYYYADMQKYDTNTERVVSHEIGHAMGLAHNDISTSVMRIRWPQVLAPSKADLDEITRMYP
ncbi:matrixin family metalloprotease [Bacillus wiedmannii]|uniref:matrixin family metalloprotease n=1 Tax=Bacillus wiedmannii TaxID=1890302 RepID=UPI003D9834AE